MQKLAYDLSALFERQPIFSEGSMQFSECFFDPATEPATVVKLMRGHMTSDYLDLVERINGEIKNQEQKSYWKEIRRLCMER
jgi:hypothetical protein